MAGRPSLAKASRYCRAVVDVGSAPRVVERWLRWLETKAPAGAVLLPSGDEGVELIARYRERLERSGFRLPPTTGKTSLAMLDKAETYELARSIGIPCPRTWAVTDVQSLDAISDELAFPCALKPRHSHLFSKHFNFKVLKANDMAELRQSVRRTGALGLEMIVTEIIPGPDHFNWAFHTYLREEDGAPLCGLTKTKLRGRPIHFGTNTFAVTRWNQEVADVALRFLQGVGLRGILYVELKWDARDEQFKLIECNHRFGNTQELMRRAGLDIVRLAYDSALGERPSYVGSWREELRIWFPLRDFRAARQYRRVGELTWRSWLRSLLSGPIITPTLALDDPLPSVLMAWRRLRSTQRGRPLAKDA